MCDAAGGVPELKNEHGLDRARCRGSSLFHVQLLLGCEALNVKRLASRDDAAGGQAAARAAQATTDEGAAEASGADRAAHSDLAARPPILPAARAIWTIALSVN